MANDTDSELHSICLGYAEELEAAVDGNLYDIDGDFKIIEDIDEWKQASYDKKVDAFKSIYPDYDHDQYSSYQEYVEDECGTVDDEEEPEQVSLFEYIEKQSLGDMRFEVDSSLEFEGGKILFAYGGPNVWVADDEVRGYWGGKQVAIPLAPDARDGLYGYLEERWNEKKEALARGYA